MTITHNTLDPGLLVVALFTYGIAVRLAITVIARRIRRYTVTKGPSEGIFREALNKVDIEPFFTHKLADDARNWKPADYLTWFPDSMAVAGIRGGTACSAWFEVKETPNKTVFPFADIRPAQLRGIATAKSLGIPYVLAIRWKPDGHWSLVDAVRLLDWWAEQVGTALRTPGAPTPKGVSRILLESRFGVSSTPGQLPNIIRAALIEGL